MNLARWNDMGMYGNVFIREIIMRVRGQILPGHRHNHDHVTFVGQGRIRAKIKSPTDGQVRVKEFAAPAWFEVPADADHEFTALTDECKCYCVFALRDADGAVAEFLDESHAADLLKGF